MYNKKDLIINLTLLLLGIKSEEISDEDADLLLILTKHSIIQERLKRSLN